METKNLIAALSLSVAVILLYTLFFPPPPETNNTKKEQIEKVQKQENSDTPSLDQNENISKISRKEALNENERISFENENIVGSISLVGATIDDLTFKKYNTKLNSNEKIVLLNPKKVENGYSIESGFVTNNKNIDTPNAASLWKVEGNKKLQKNNPIKLIWKNDQGMIFEKKMQKIICF